MNERQLIELTQQWRPEHVLAVYDFCSLISDARWEQHEETLLAYMMKRERENSCESLSSYTPNNHELPFDDPIPF